MYNVQKVTQFSNIKLTFSLVDFAFLLVRRGMRTLVNRQHTRSTELDTSNIMDCRCLNYTQNSDMDYRWMF